ncbi:hypothetical protein ACIPSA_28385 [Streptomyces sp. NPDC086549]|uniref:hypothetical protein n=1 Tax=Streptomyces sp. NPDC086549 TaxID=3365752 RepID=UPI00382B22B7
MPSHHGDLIADLTRRYADTWREFANELDGLAPSRAGVSGCFDADSIGDRLLEVPALGEVLVVAVQGALDEFE